MLVIKSLQEGVVERVVTGATSALGADCRLALAAPERGGAHLGGARGIALQTGGDLVRSGLCSTRE
jgi:hypothetical protein